MKKQETLEEASLRYNPIKKLDGEFIRQAFKDGASWQSKRMYSEEEVLDLILKSKIETAYLYYEEMEEWFEQFKKE